MCPDKLLWGNLFFFLSFFCLPIKLEYTKSLYSPYTQRNRCWIWLIYTKFLFSLQFSDWFSTKQNSAWCWIYRKTVITIQIFVWINEIWKIILCVYSLWKCWDKREEEQCVECCQILTNIFFQFSKKLMLLKKKSVLM